MNMGDEGALSPRMQAELREDAARERDMRAVVDSGVLLLWIGMPDGTRRWLGTALAKFTGLAPHALAGAGWVGAIHPEDAERCAAIDKLCLAADRRFTLDYRLRGHDGRYVWVMDSATPDHDAAGRFTGHIGVCIDIDERHAVEDRLAERLRQLRVSGRV